MEMARHALPTSPWWKTAASGWMFILGVAVLVTAVAGALMT